MSTGFPRSNERTPLLLSPAQDSASTMIRDAGRPADITVSRGDTYDPSANAPASAEMPRGHAILPPPNTKNTNPQKSCTRETAKIYFIRGSLIISAMVQAFCEGAISLYQIISAAQFLGLIPGTIRDLPVELNSSKLWSQLWWLGLVPLATFFGLLGLNITENWKLAKEIEKNPYFFSRANNYFGEITFTIIGALAKVAVFESCFNQVYNAFGTSVNRKGHGALEHPFAFIFGLQFLFINGPALIKAVREDEEDKSNFTRHLDAIYKKYLAIFFVNIFPVIAAIFEGVFDSVESYDIAYAYLGLTREPKDIAKHMAWLPGILFGLIGSSFHFVLNGVIFRNHLSKFIEEITHPGYDLHVLNEKPEDQDLENYKDSYILLKKQDVYYVSETKESGSIASLDLDKLKELIAKDPEKNKFKLSNRKIKELIKHKSVTTESSINAAENTTLASCALKTLEVLTKFLRFIFEVFKFTIALASFSMSYSGQIELGYVFKYGEPRPGPIDVELPQEYFLDIGKKILIGMLSLFPLTEAYFVEGESFEDLLNDWKKHYNKNRGIPEEMEDDKKVDKNIEKFFLGFPEKQIIGSSQKYYTVARFLHDVTTITTVTLVKMAIDLYYFPRDVDTHKVTINQTIVTAFVSALMAGFMVLFRAVYFSKTYSTLSQNDLREGELICLDGEPDNSTVLSALKGYGLFVMSEDPRGDISDFLKEKPAYILVVDNNKTPKTLHYTKNGKDDFKIVKFIKPKTIQDFVYALKIEKIIEKAKISEVPLCIYNVITLKQEQSLTIDEILNGPLPFLTNSAYIRYDDKLYYANKSRNELIDVKMTRSKMREFDLKMKLTSINEKFSFSDIQMLEIWDTHIREQKKLKFFRYDASKASSSFFNKSVAVNAPAISAIILNGDESLYSNKKISISICSGIDFQKNKEVSGENLKSVFRQIQKWNEDHENNKIEDHVIIFPYFLGEQWGLGMLKIEIEGLRISPTVEILNPLKRFDIPQALIQAFQSLLEDVFLRRDELNRSQPTNPFVLTPVNRLNDFKFGEHEKQDCEILSAEVGKYILDDQVEYIKYIQPVSAIRKEYILNTQNLKIPKNTVLEGLKLEIVPGDGHCLFRAVALHYPPERDYQALRNEVTAYIKQNADAEDRFIIQALAPEMTLEDYLIAMQNREWADQYEITILRKILKRQIIIIDFKGNLRDKYNAEPLPGDVDEPLFIQYNGYNHYNGYRIKVEFNAHELAKELLSQKYNNSDYPLLARERESNFSYSRLFSWELDKISDITGYLPYYQLTKSYLFWKFLSTILFVFAAVFGVEYWLHTDFLVKGIQAGEDHSRVLTAQTTGAIIGGVVAAGAYRMPWRRIQRCCFFSQCKSSEKSKDEEPLQNNSAVKLHKL